MKAPAPITVVVSPPRTGTNSICEMAAILGFKPLHGPPDFNHDFDFYADCPCWDPDVINKLTGSRPDLQFIYLTRPPADWLKSMQKTGLAGVGTRQANEKSRTGRHFIDTFGRELLSEDNYLRILGRHHEQMAAVTTGFPLLHYSFTDGWPPLCAFLGKECPAASIPHLNKNGTFQDDKKSMLCLNRLEAVRFAMQTACTLPGHIAEFGVCRGGTAKVLAETKSDKQSLYLFDSWEGCPETGMCRFPFDKFTDNMAGYDYVLKKGMFSATVPSWNVPVAFAHIDCDEYAGTKLCLDRASDLAVPGALLIVDDYNRPEVMRAVDEDAHGWNRRVIQGVPDNSVLLFK